MSNDTNDIKIRGEQGGDCQYEDCKTEASVLVRLVKTKPTLHVWFCPPHAGNTIKNHDDADSVQPRYLCVTCGEYKRRNEFETGDCTCRDCYDEDRSGVNYELENGEVVCRV